MEPKKAVTQPAMGGWRGTSRAMACRGSGFAGRLVEASRVPPCSYDASAFCVQAQSPGDEGRPRRNTEPKKTEPKHATGGRRGAPGAMACRGSGFAGRLVEASRVPPCSYDASAFCVQAQSPGDEGRPRRNMEPKKTEPRQAIARYLYFTEHP